MIPRKIGSFAWALWSLRVPRPWWFVLALPALGTLFVQRLEMLRPQVWLIGFTVLVVALLVERRWKALFVVCALFGLTHTGGWIAIPLAVLWSLSGVAARGEPEESRIPWQPVAAAAGGWLLGQLVHPEVPANFRLFCPDETNSNRLGAGFDVENRCSPQRRVDGDDRLASLASAPSAARRPGSGVS